MNKILITSSIALLISLSSAAQNILTQEIRWNSSTWFEASAGSNFDYPTTITTSQNRIIWKYSQGDSVKHDMTIRKTNGSWTNISQSGSIMFEADEGSDSAIVEFKRVSGRTFVRLVIAKQEQTLIYEIDITGTEVL